MLLEALAGRTPGLRRVRRPETGSAPAFDLAYVRTGPRTDAPVVVIPGGPGLGSVLPYRGLRRIAAGGDLDVVMIEHRGVGLSRTDAGGHPLPFSAMRIADVLDDIAAVLDHEGVATAFVAGSSYGSYLASGLGARHPDRVRGILLDSALQSTGDLGIERAAVRALMWDADDEIGDAVRRLVAAGADQRRLLDVARAAYELGGAGLLRPLLRRRVRGARSAVWAALEMYATRDASIARIPGVYEFDIAGAIGFRELHYGAPGDGGPMDPALTYAPSAAAFPGFAGEPYDLTAEVARFAWPMVLLSGTRDLRTPPAIADRVAATARDAVLVRIENGHSALDTHPVAFLNAVRRLVRGQQDRLPAEASALDHLPKRGLSARLPALLAAGVRLESLVG